MTSTINNSSTATEAALLAAVQRLTQAVEAQAAVVAGLRLDLGKATTAVDEHKRELDQLGDQLAARHRLAVPNFIVCAGIVGMILTSLILTVGSVF